MLAYSSGEAREVSRGETYHRYRSWKPIPYLLSSYGKERSVKAQ
ncbi:MAG: hypothetical protein RMX65_022140 [Nostoc sp. DedQUE01]